MIRNAYSRIALFGFYFKSCSGDAMMSNMIDSPILRVCTLDELKRYGMEATTSDNNTVQVSRDME